MEIECPKCRYKRVPTDQAPAWQCPQCGVAYAKVAAMASLQRDSPAKATQYEPPSPRSGKSWAKEIALASAILIMLGGTWGYTKYRDHQLQEEQLQRELAAKAAETKRQADLMTEAATRKRSATDDSVLNDEGRRLLAVFKDRLKDPDAVKIRNLKGGTTPSSPYAICGEANGKNSYGGYTGFKGFVVSADGSVWEQSDDLLENAAWCVQARNIGCVPKDLVCVP